LTVLPDFPWTGREKEEERMKTLVVEDDFTSRLLLQEILKDFGTVHIAVNGVEAVEAMSEALRTGQPYDLVCLDIMMPEMDGHEALKKIRELEKEAGVLPNDEVKVVMTTALGDPKNVFEAYYRGGATSYVVKPIHKRELLDRLRALQLVE